MTTEIVSAEEFLQDPGLKGMVARAAVSNILPEFKAWAKAESERPGFMKDPTSSLITLLQAWTRIYIAAFAHHVSLLPSSLDAGFPEIIKEEIDKLLLHNIKLCRTGQGKGMQATVALPPDRETIQ